MTERAHSGEETEDEGGRPSVRGALRNAGAILSAHAAAHVVRTLSMLVVLVALAREDYGTLTAAVAFVDPIRSLAVLGMDTVALRRAAIEPRRLPEIIGSLLRIRVVLGVLAFIVAVGAALTVRAEAAGGPVVIVCAALAIVPAAVHGSLETAFQARQRMRRMIGVPATAAAAYLVSILFLWWLGAALPWFIAAAAVGDVVAAALAARLLRPELEASAGPGARLRADNTLSREMMHQGLPLAFVNVVVVLYQRAGIYLVERTGDLGEVADLGAAIRLTLPLLLIGAAMAVSLAPYTSRLTADHGYDEFVRFFRRLILYALLLATPPAVLGGWLAEPVLAWLKPEYLGAVPVVRWMAFAAVLMVVCQVTTASLVGLGAFRGIAMLEVVNLSVFLVLAFPLVERLGAEGAAAAMVGMQGINACLQITAVLAILHRRRAAQSASSSSSARR